MQKCTTLKFDSPTSFNGKGWQIGPHDDNSEGFAHTLIDAKIYSHVCHPFREEETYCTVFRVKTNIMT